MSVQNSNPDSIQETPDRLISSAPETGPESLSQLIVLLTQSGFRSPVVFWISIYVALLPFMVLYSIAMWHQPLYQYFPFLLLGVFGLAYMRSDGSFRFPEGRLSITCAVIAILVLILAAVLASSWLGAIAFILFTVSFFSTLRGQDGRKLTYLTLPLLMFVRAPQMWTYAVMFRLQGMTTKLSSVLLDVAGIPHDHAANTIELADKKLFVAEACSGVQSLFTMCFLAFLLLVYRRRTLLLTPVYLAAAIVLAVLGNIIRVTSIAVFQAWFEVDLSVGWQHELVGYIALAISAGVLLSFDHLISLFFHPVEASETAILDNPLLVAWNRIFRKRDYATFKSQASSRKTGQGSNQSRYEAALEAASQTRGYRLLGYRIVVGIAFACAVMMIGWKLFRTPDRRPIVATDAILFQPSDQFLAAADVPITVIGHQRVRDSQFGIYDRLGKNADVWQCGIGERRGDFVISQPYIGWHELTVCYRVLDWNMLGRKTIEFPGSREPIVMGSFFKDGLYGSLFFSGVNSNGELPRTPGYSPSARALAPIYPLIMDDFAERTGSAQTVMIQYWTVSQQELTPEETREIAKTMHELRAHVSDEIASQTNSMLPGS